MKHTKTILVILAFGFIAIQCTTRKSIAPEVASNSDPYLCKNAATMSQIQGSIVLPLAQDVPGYKEAKTQAAKMAVLRTFLQTMADTFVWNTFISVNWPARLNGEPDPSVCIGSQPAVTVWEHWMPSYNVYHNNPAPWSDGIGKNNHRPLNSSEPIEHRIIGKQNDLVDINAEDKPVIDQYGNYTLYEVFYNESVFDYITQSGLNTEEGQEKFMKTFPDLGKGMTVVNNRTGDTINNEETMQGAYFSIGNVKDSIEVKDTLTYYFTVDQGAVVIKSAWRQLTKNDDISRYHVRKVKVEDHGSMTLGLVGMHLVHKVAESTQWLWGTFQHVDNAPPMGDDGIAVPDPGRPYSYFDPSDLDPKNYNIPPPDGWEHDPAKRIPVQLVQEIPTNDDVKALNDYYKKLIKEVNDDSPWQYYEMVGTQWPFDPTLYTLGGTYTPAKLGNAVMETYDQKNSSCMDCHRNARFLHSAEKRMNGYSADFIFSLNIED